MKFLVAIILVMSSHTVHHHEVAHKEHHFIVNNEQKLVDHLTAKWITSNWDPTAYQPNGGPMATLPIAYQVRFACVRYTESRNHPTSLNLKSGSGGLYGFLKYIWAAYGGLHYASVANKATGPEQDQIAVNVYKANKYHGFGTEWTDNC